MARNYFGQEIPETQMFLGALGGGSSPQQNASNLDMAKWRQNQADKERMFGSMFPMESSRPMELPGSSEGDRPSPAAKPSGSSDIMSQILAALGGVGDTGSRPFQGTTGSSTNIADVGSVSTEGTMPYEIAALNAGTTNQGNVMDLISKLFGTKGQVDIAGIGADASKYGEDQRLAGSKYGADANTEQARIAADAQRAVADLNQTPARLQNDWRMSQIGNLLAAKPRPSANGSGTDVTSVMSPQKDGGLQAILAQLLQG